MYLGVKVIKEDFGLLEQKENEAINELASLINRLRKFEEPARKILLRRYPAEKVVDAEGKRAIVTISGLRFHDLVYSFQVTGLSIEQVEPMEGYDTWIDMPLDVIVTVVKKVLSGQQGALNEAFTDNRVKIRGKKVYHDMSAFEGVFDTLSENIRRFKEATR